MKTCTFAAAALVAAFAASNAAADIVNVNYIGKGKGSDVKLTIGSSTFNAFAGQLKHNISGAVGDFAPLNGTQITFCTDLLQYVSSNTTAYELVPVSTMPDWSPMGAGKADAIQDIYNGASGLQLTSTVSNEYATAFQLAVWEIVSDYNPNNGPASISLTGGSFKAKKTNGNNLTGGIVTAFNTIMGFIGDSYNSDTPIAGITSDRAQDQIVSGVSVPAPGAAVLAGLGLGLVSLRRRTQA